MKNYKIILLLFSLLIACNQRVAQEEKTDNTFTIDEKLVKLPKEILDINWTGGTLDADWGDGKIHPNQKYPDSYFKDDNGICNLSDDTLFITSHQGMGMGPNNSLDITICKGVFDVTLFENNCTYRHKYKMLQQSLELNKSTFQIGDTLTGKLFYQAIYIWDSIKRIVDTTTISGKFKLKIRSKFFNKDSLYTENNFKQLLIEMSNLRPDTITKLYIFGSGLTSLPNQLSNFKNLEMLDIAENDLKNADLAMLCNLKNLKALTIRNCNLTKVPICLGLLTNIEELDLYNNDITVIPKELFKLRKLKKLQLGGNLLTSLPAEILNLKKLEILEISGQIQRNRIKKLPKDFFKYLPNLHEFYAPDNLDTNEYKDYKPKADK